MKIINLSLISISLIILWSSCDFCTRKKRNKVIVRQQKRVIINASGVDVVLRVLSTDVDSIYRDTITQFTHVYRIASNDSVISVQECITRGVCYRPSDPECNDIVGTFNFDVRYFNYGQLVFDNRSVQTFHLINQPIKSIFNGFSYTIDRSDADLPVFTYTITPEDYENAEPIDP